MSRAPVSPASAPAAAEPASPFRRLLCGVDAGRRSREAVRHALLLGAGGHVDFVAVSEVVGVGANRRSNLSPARARAALDDALRAAREAGVDAAADVVPAEDPTSVLLERVRAYDLLVIGSHGHSRAESILVGTTTGIALHRSDVPVWVARGERTAFPGPVVVATAATPGDLPVVETAARVAARFSVPLTLLRVGDTRSAIERDALALQVSRAEMWLGVEPVVAVEDGRTVDRILHFTEGLAAALVVLGSRRKSGVRALTSVSERVATQTRCSALVIRN